MRAPYATPMNIVTDEVFTLLSMHVQGLALVLRGTKNVLPLMRSVLFIFAFFFLFHQPHAEVPE